MAESRSSDHPKITLVCRRTIARLWKEILRLPLLSFCVLILLALPLFLCVCGSFALHCAPIDLLQPFLEEGKSLGVLHPNRAGSMEPMQDELSLLQDRESFLLQVCAGASAGTRVFCKITQCFVNILNHL